MTEPESSWIQRAADRAAEHAERAGKTQIVCESGISPSGPIHLGNLREVMTVHLVAEELKSRGLDAVHLHSWDDYDRFRKVPAGLPESLAEHVGKPLAHVPDPDGKHTSYADRFMAEFKASLQRMGVSMTERRQSEHYPRGDYNAAIRMTMERRAEIFDILNSFQTPGRNEKPVEERRAAYYPYKPYCEVCGKDSTTVTGYADGVVEYRCACKHTGSQSLADGQTISGKLVWKVDWPMRWTHEGVDFEPAGEDHHAPTSSFNSGGVLMDKVFGAPQPYSFAYTFVGLSGGSSKMSGSAGGAAIPATALDVIEPPMVRWLYVRRNPGQPFTIDLSPRAVQRLYDEWDRFAANAKGSVDADGVGVAEKSTAPSTVDKHLHDVCVRTSVGAVEHSKRPVSFRLLSSVADLTQGNHEQIERLVGQHLQGEQFSLDDLEPRLTCAINYATRLLPPEDRTILRTEFNADAWAALDEQTQKGVQLLDERLADNWSLDGLTTLVYGVPKILQGLPEDTKPTPELKKSQRAFFKALYQLLCSSDTGPRLPTLLLSIGQDKVHQLLSGA